MHFVYEFLNENKILFFEHRFFAQADGDSLWGEKNVTLERHKADKNFTVEWQRGFVNSLEFTLVEWSRSCARIIPLADTNHQIMAPTEGHLGEITIYRTPPHYFLYMSISRKSFTV